MEPFNLEIDLSRLTNTRGVGQAIVCDKCDSQWYERDCPNPPTCAEYHYGQFGHKIVFLFCDECHSKPDPWDRVFSKATERTLREGRGFEVFDGSCPYPRSDWAIAKNL